MRYPSVLVSLLSLAWCVHGERVDNGYIVELSQSPAKSSVLQHASRQVRYTYDSDLLYGVSVEFADSASAKAALAHPDVVNTWSISQHTRPTALFDTRQESTAKQDVTLQPYSPVRHCLFQMRKGRLKRIAVILSFRNKSPRSHKAIAKPIISWE